MITQKNLDDLSLNICVSSMSFYCNKIDDHYNNLEFQIIFLQSQTTESFTVTISSMYPYVFDSSLLSFLTWIQEDLINEVTKDFSV